jgi:type I restriction enzyme S subunit
MSVRAPVGEVSRTEFDCCIGRGVCSISYKNNYLYHYLIFFEKSWGQFSTGSTFDSVNSNQVKSILVPLPPSLTEQKAIATALSDVDDFISNLDKLIAKKKDIKKGAMQQLLTPPNKGGIRLPGFSGEWEVKRLGDIAEFLKGKGLPKSELVQDGTNKCIHYGELFTKYSEVIITVQSSTNSNVNSFFSVFNDVLMPTSDVTPNGLATASAIFEDEILLGGDILVIRTNPKELNGAFLAYQVSVNRPQIMSLVSGTTVYHLYGSDMAEFIFSAPKPDEQNAIVEILEDMKNEINSLEKTRQKYNELKQGMMQQLLTGKTRLV